ncbi:LysR family transcriptional regulator [Sandaracinus amylolyticus]|uniref:LysR family transcriptional regulator n=1 Tax=Sandaracinus amylolyticus TaxID=927083 RepID=UPI001F256C90|nr:LysR family transcriptional regulator [Sandaracinus amylolyticus]UJR86445.1 Hypothetical protein I5071_85400 [Sandaracinus amylolyticus]
MSFDLDRLSSLALFARVVQLRSFTAAAEQSGIAKSAVSARISELERRLGVQLLRRSTRKLALTDEGVRFYEHCARVLESADAAEASVAAASADLRGTLRVSAPIAFAQMHLAGVLSDFLARHPELEIELSADDRFVDVVEGGFDVVVRIGRLEPSGLVARRLASDRLVVCGSPAYLARVGTPESPADLVHHNCLHYALVSQRGEWRFRGDDGSALTIPVRGNLTTTSGSVLREAAIAGLGLAVLPSFMVARDVAEGRLELVLEGRRRAEIGVFAITAGRQLPARTRALVEHLARAFADAPWAVDRGRARARGVGKTRSHG